MISFKSAFRLAMVSFIFGTVLFLAQLALGESFVLIGIGLIYIAIAGLANSITALVALINLIKTDYLESFYALCILLANIPIAMGYLYILSEYNGL